jgi:hypothetical protein
VSDGDDARSPSDGASTPLEGAEDVPDRFLVDFTGRTLLGTYRVERKLADGGMGSVYLAQDVSLGMRVVVKVPHARFLSEPGFRARFRREVSELVRLEHPHIVRILARGDEDGVPYFVLQYLGGGTLQDRLASGAQSPEVVATWLMPIARTLDFVHGRGVVHRDVKPGNILFDEQGHVFLSDFGVVKALEGGGDGAVTDVGTAVGSPGYMAPEQALGRDVTPAADQYALASTVYEALSGEPPFGRGAPVEVAIRKQQEAPPSLGDKVSSLPPACADAVARALSTDPAARFPTCAALADAFTAPLAVPPEPRSAGRPSRTRALVLATLVLLGALTVGALARWFGLAPAPVATRAPNVVLVDAGAEPRRIFRVRLPAGAEDRITLRFEDSTVRTFHTYAPLETGLVREQDVEVRVAGVDEDGAARLAWSVGRARTTPKEGTPPEFVEAETKLYEAIGPVRLTGTMAPHGGIGDVVIDLPEGPAREAAIGSGLEEMVRQLEVPLPSEPIGVGAVWDVTRFARVLGMRFHESATFELVEVEGERLRLRFQMMQSAPDQTFTLPGQGEDFKTAIEAFQSSGRGEIRLDLSRPTPLEYSSNGTFTFSGRMAGGRFEGKPIRIEATFEMRLLRP